MAAVCTTRHWESDDSGDLSLVDYTFESVSSRWKWPKDDDEKKSTPKKVNQGSGSRAIPTYSFSLAKRKNVKINPKMPVLAKPHERTTETVLRNLTKIKPSALLYEITERTNQLAQPRNRAVSEAQFTQQVKISHISKPSLRILELSRPRMTHESYKKPDNYVSPKALRAVATERIIQLSQPKKIPYSKTLKTKKKLSTSRPRSFVNSYVVMNNYTVCRNQVPQLNRMTRGPLWTKTRKLKRRRFDGEHKKQPKGKKPQTSKKSQKCIAMRNSDRSVIMLNLNFRNNSYKNC